MNEQDQPPKSENEIADYYDNVRAQEMLEYESGIKKGRNTLYAIGILLLIAEIIRVNSVGVDWTPIMIGIVAVECGIFIALGLWTKSKPFSAILTGLIVFAALWVLAIVVVGGRAAYSGIVVRIVIFALLIGALKPARAWEAAKRSGS